MSYNCGRLLCREKHRHWVWLYALGRDPEPPRWWPRVCRLTYHPIEVRAHPVVWPWLALVRLVAGERGLLWVTR